MIITVIYTYARMLCLLAVISAWLHARGLLSSTETFQLHVYSCRLKLLQHRAVFLE